jgi:hypothetical protein
MADITMYDTDDHLRQRLIHDVADAVCTRTEARATSLVKDIESRGHIALVVAQQKQLEFVSEVQGKLAEFAASYELLMRENAALKSGLDAAMYHIQMLHWASGMSPCSQQLQGGTTPPCSQRKAQATSKLESLPEEEDDVDLVDVEQQQHDDVHDAKVAGANVAGDSLVSLTLRRIADQPLGLEVRPDAERSCLHVEGIQHGTVVDAWNQQCIGEPRAILPGDRIVSVNGATTPEGMRKEFVEKLLLKFEVAKLAPDR